MSKGIFPLYHPFKSQKAKELFFELYNSMAEDWPVPSQSIVIDTSYGKTFVRRCGPADASPLVLLHPGGSNSLAWIPQVKILSGKYAVYAVDNIYDNGLSINTRTVSGIDDYMNWLTELFNALGLKDNINLMGMSYGAWLACMFTVKYPGRVSKAVLLAPPVTIMPVDPGFILRAFLLLLPGRFFYNRFMEWFFKDYINKDRENALKAIDNLYRVSRLFKYRRLPNPSLLTDDELKNISVPVLYIIGENEKVYSARNALERIHRLAPQVNTELVPGSGHDMLAVEPVLIMDKVMDFLNS
jgi:pimeloyl-ACP methyl ester carboxylesterase